MIMRVVVDINLVPGQSEPVPGDPLMVYWPPVGQDRKVLIGWGTILTTFKPSEEPMMNPELFMPKVCMRCGNPQEPFTKATACETCGSCMVCGFDGIAVDQTQEEQHARGE